MKRKLGAIANRFALRCAILPTLLGVALASSLAGAGDVALPFPPNLNVSDFGAQGRMDGPIFPLEGETVELFAGGPKMTKKGNTLEISLGADRSEGYLVAYYGVDGSLMRTETYNDRGRRITWTTYGLSRGKIKGIVETAYDLAETGHPTAWEISESDPKAKPPGSKLVKTRYELDKHGRRIEVSHQVFSEAQACETQGGTLDNSLCTKISDIVDHADATGKCDSTDNLTLQYTQGGAVTGSRKPTFEAAGPICLDKSCEVFDHDSFQCVVDIPECSPANHDLAVIMANRNCDPRPTTGYECPSGRNWIRAPAGRKDNNAFASLIKDTVREGASCLAALGMKGASASSAAAGLDAIRNNTTTDANSAFLKSRFALRNAAMLLSVFNQNSHPGSYFDPAKQQWVLYDSATQNSRNANASELRTVANQSFGPLKVTCDGNYGKYVFKNDNDKQANVAAAFDQSNGVAATAMGLLPGASGWPMLVLRPNPRIGDTTTEAGRRMREEYKATLFHEMMHILGYPHADPYVPTHSACQVCCFPEGWKRPCRMTSGGKVTDGHEATRKAACDVCSGAKGTSTTDASFQAAFPSYKQNMCACYGMKTPHLYSEPCIDRR